tara:strand:- start:19 stop:219 length:201 start_codon:yes stop_codon:yes gene_type:complete
MTVLKADLEAKLREIETVVEETAVGVKNTGVITAIGTVAAVGLSFLLGKRRGRRARRTQVEIFRTK